jgi:hypothetical protein
MKCFLLLLIFSFPALAGLPVDLVVDIDLTIAALVPDKPNADLLGGPPENLITVRDERYRVFQGVRDRFAHWVKEKQAAGLVRLHFFSGGTEVRNEALLRAIKLQDGTSLWDLCEGRSHGRSALTPTGLGPPHHIRDRFKKDLRTINPDISDVILVDDIKEFAPDSQRDHVLWIGEDFPFPDRFHEGAIPSLVPPQVKERELKKYDWIVNQLDRALNERVSSGRSMALILPEITQHQSLTPFTSKLPSAIPVCDPLPVLDRLLGSGL